MILLKENLSYGDFTLVFLILVLSEFNYTIFLVGE